MLPWYTQVSHYDERVIATSDAYIGIPPMKYGQSYYTLRSIFFDRVPPPVIHVHLRVFDVAKDVPIGDISASNPSAVPTKKSSAQPVEVDFPEEEKTKFDLWVRDLWREKDELIVRFLETGSFVAGKPDDKSAVDIPLKVLHKREILDAFCFFIPALCGCVWAKLRGTG